MAIRLGVVMDPIDRIHVEKDSSLAMLLEAQARGYRVEYMEVGDLYARAGQAYARARPLKTYRDATRWYALDAAREVALAELDAILMRKDPPVDADYTYAAQLLALAEDRGTLVVNKPRALLEVNEKLAILRFPELIPPTLVARRRASLRAFVDEQRDVVLKPLHGMGGLSIFRARPDDPNLNVILETLTDFDRQLVMAQRFIPEIRAGDKRILLIGGEPVPHALARVPGPDDPRGNMAAGARPEGRALSARDRAICEALGPWLRAQGILFAGIDVIGDFLTEINVTSPTGIRELDKFFGLNIAGGLFDAIERALAAATQPARARPRGG